MNQKTSTQTRFLLFFLFPLCSFLFVFSCLNPLAVDKDGPAEYTADGRRLVNVSVKASTRGGGAARSLTPGLAQAGTDYYEAIFVDGAEYHRIAWHKGQTAKIKVPAGDYATVDKAILLAGRFDGRVLTLLAAGELTRVNGVDGTNIDGSTTSVTFTLTALECVVDDTAASGFQITPTNSSGTTTINGRTIPYFNVPKNDATVQAKLTIDGVPAAGTNYPLKLKGTPALTSVGYTTELDLPASVEASSGTGVTLDEGTALKQDVTLDLKTSNTDGWCALAVDVPLSAYAIDKDHDVWHLRSGINYTQLDYGAASPGGMTLLRVGNPAGGGILITSVIGGPPVVSSSIKINGVTHRLMDYPAWATEDADGRAALLCNTDPSATTTMNIGTLSFQKGQVEELILGGDLAGLTTVSSGFAFFFSNLAAVDLSGLSDVTGVQDLFLAASGLSEVDLSPLSKVTRIGDRFLMFNANLDDFDSLNLSALTSLENVGNMFLYQCSFTDADLSGLTNLESIGDDFLGDNNLNSVNLSGLSSLRTIGDSFLGENTNLNSVNLSGLSSLESIGMAFLTGKANLTSLDLSDLTGLKTIGDTFFENSGNNATVNLSGLTSLESIGNSFLAGSNLEDGATISLSGSTLTSIGGSFLYDNKDNLHIDLRGLTASSMTIDNSFLLQCEFNEVYMGTIEPEWIGEYSGFVNTPAVGTIRVPAVTIGRYISRFNYIDPARFVEYP